MQTVLIADDDREFVDILSKKISEDASFKIVARMGDGYNAIETIEQLRPDILLLDIILPGSDGIYIVEYIRQRMQVYRPAIYILSGMGTSSVVKRLNLLDIDYFSLKPVSLDAVMRNLQDVSSRRDERGIGTKVLGQGETRITDPISEQIERLTIQLGITPHRKSTQCINEALKFCLEHAEGTRLITKVLYPEIARRHGTSSSTVERNIRYAISAMRRARTPVYERMFSFAEGRRMTNSEFLAVVSEYLHMNEYINS